MAVEFALLRCLVEEPSHGYLLQKSIASLRNSYPVANVNVYPILKQLEQRGLVTSETRFEQSRARKVYEITTAGRQALRDWLASSPESELPTVRDLACLKLALATPDSPDFEWLRSAVATTELEAQRLREQLGESGGSMVPLALMAAEESISVLERRISFLRQAMRWSSANRPRDGEGSARQLAPCEASKQTA